MKVKKYVRYQLKSWLSLMIAFATIVFAMTVIVGLNASPSVVASPLESSEGGFVTFNSASLPLPLYSYSRLPSSSIAEMLIPSLLAACILPFFAFGHRYGKVRADCYLSLPTKDGQVTRIRVLILGAFLLVTYLGSYLFGIGAAIARQFITVASLSAKASQAGNVVLTIVYGSFGWYFVAWIFGLFVVAGFYALNCFFVSQGNNVIQGLIGLLSGNIVVNLFTVLSICLLIRFSASSDWYTDFGLNRLFILSPGVYVPVYMMESIFGMLEIHAADAAESVYADWPCWLSFASFLVLAVGSAFYLLRGKEPGGESAGADRPRNPFAIALPHLAAGVLFSFNSILFSVLFVTSSSFSYQYISFLVFVAALVWGGGIYYVVLSLYNRNFKLNLPNWISFAAILTGSFVLFLSTNLVPLY